MADQTVGSLHYQLRAAVVLLQFTQFDIVIQLIEIQDIIDIGTTKAVYALCIVAHHANLLPLPGEQPYYLLLHLVGILILVHKHILIPLLIPCEHIRMMIKEQECIDQQIIKIHGIGSSASATINLIDLSCFGHLSACVFSHPCRTLTIGRRQYKMIFGHANAVGHDSRLIGLVVQFHLFDDGLYKRA